jgi:hypothetical protein
MKENKMSDLVDMKLPKRSKEEMKKDCMPCSTEDQDRWPYGLQLRFEKDQVAKLPILTKFKIGEKVMVMAEATVTSIRMSERQGGQEDHSVELQIEKISLEPKVKKAPEKMSLKEYKEFRGV